MTAKEKKTIEGGMAIGLGASLLLHAAAGLLFFTLADGLEAARQPLITIVLTGMPPAVEPPPLAKAPAPVQQKARNRRETPAASEYPCPHPRSVPDAQVDPVVPAPVEAATPSRVQVAAPSAPQQPETAPIAPAERTPAGKGGSPAGGEAMRDRMATPGSGSAIRTADADRSAYLQEHFVYIREQILQHLAYPSVARRMGWKGQLTVSFVIGETGGVENLRIVKSSGFKILDDNALKTIEQIQPFPKPPIRAEIVVPIEYRLG